MGLAWRIIGCKDERPSIFECLGNGTNNRRSRNQCAPIAIQPNHPNASLMFDCHDLVLFDSPDVLLPFRLRPRNAKLAELKSLFVHVLALS